MQPKWPIGPDFYFLQAQTRIGPCLEEKWALLRTSYLALGIRRKNEGKGNVYSTGTNAGKWLHHSLVAALWEEIKQNILCNIFINYSRRSMCVSSRQTIGSILCRVIPKTWKTVLTSFSASCSAITEGCKAKFYALLNVVVREEVQRW